MPNRRRSGIRRTLRNQRRKALRQGDSKTAATIGYALRNKNIFNDMLKEVEGVTSTATVVDEDGTERTVATELGDGQLLQWFLDNFEYILSVILKLIG